MLNNKRGLQGNSYQRYTNEQATYVGHTECQFKTRYNGHTSSFRNAKYKHATELSKHVWNLNDKNVKYSIKWRVLARCNSYSNKTKRCHLCLHEKYIIIITLNLPLWTLETNFYLNLDTRINSSWAISEYIYIYLWLYIYIYTCGFIRVINRVT